MTVERYREALHFDLWNQFSGNAANATFLHHRNYLDYHADRFTDHSLLVLNNSGKVLALLPLNQADNNRVVSHSGLTYGGLLLLPDAKLVQTLEIVFHILKYLHQAGIKTVDLKVVPAFYSESPTDMSDYALFLLNASLYRRDTALVIDQHHRVPYSGNIRREGTKAEKAGAVIREEDTLSTFWTDLLVPNLQARFGVRPVHSLAEINLLQNRFPQNIKQYSVYLDGEIMAGTTLFLTPQVAHCQYIASSETGRRNGCLNYLFKHLIDVTFAQKRYFDFGIANENEGRDLNTGMLFWKEGFGGRAHKHDFYRIETQNYPSLEKFLA